MTSKWKLIYHHFTLQNYKICKRFLNDLILVLSVQYDIRWIKMKSMKISSFPFSVIRHRHLILNLPSLQYIHRLNLRVVYMCIVYERIFRNQKENHKWKATKTHNTKHFLSLLLPAVSKEGKYANMSYRLSTNYSLRGLM